MTLPVKTVTILGELCGNCLKWGSITLPVVNNALFNNGVAY